MRKPRFSTHGFGTAGKASALAVVAAFALAACGSSSSGGSGRVGLGAATTGPIVVAAFNFGESKILANMYVGRAQEGRATTRRSRRSARARS